MRCGACGQDNREGANFCEECGAAFPRACVECGTELSPTAKFCSECGTPVAGRAGRPAPDAPAPVPAEDATVGARKIVTILFADLAGSTALHERLDPESARRFMESYYEAARDAVESHGGVVTQLLGDGVKAVFGVPLVAEDDAVRAVRAGVAMQEGFRALVDRVRGTVGETGLRVAVNTGEVVAKGGSEIIGDPVNVAARLQEQGRDGDVVVGGATARLVESLVTLAPLGTFALKGRAGEVAAFRVESLDPPGSAATAAFVGRDDEIARMLSVYGRAVETPATALAVLLGSPGLGKSRLIDEFARRLEGAARFVHAQCGDAAAATFAPIAVALRELLGLETGASDETVRAALLAEIAEGDTDRERVARGIAALLAGSPASLEETFFVVRRLFAALAAERPVVLVIDDLQWAEPVLLDLVEHLVEWGSDVPLLVLVGARPELRDKRSSLATPGGLVADVVMLAGLDAGAAMRLAASVIGAEELPATVAAKVLATSEGNPLFVCELVRMLVHEGALEREGGRWTTGTALAALEMPPTIHALLAARIERLQPDERRVLQHAAVIGRSFSRSALADLLSTGVDDLAACLDSLQRSELIQRDTGWFFGEPLLRFHHVLIRDAAYRQMLKGTRADLHARFADWAVARAGDSPEHDETIGWHLEQAHQLLCELGPLDDAGREIGERAAKHLAAAGRRAFGGDDVPLAASLLGRAIARLESDDPGRAELALDWCEALLAAGDVGRASEAIDDLDRVVGDSERLRAWHTCFAGQHAILTAPERLQQTVDQVAAAAGTLSSRGDDAGEAKAHYVHALALSRLGQVGACEAALDLALAAARRVAGDRRRANMVLAIAPLAALWGPSAVTRASGRCLDVVRVLRITQGAPAVEAVALSCQGVLEALRGRTDAARRMIASARGLVEELGITQRLRELDVFAGLVDLYEGKPAEAARSLRVAYDGLRELGLGVDAARAAALLARALLAQGRVEEAEALSHESEALAGDDLKAAIAWRGARAEALARRGEHADAVAFASEAVEMAAATDARLDHADARLALAAALRAAGRNRDAEAEQRRAHELWAAKGATLLAERARTGEARGAREPVAAQRPDVAAPHGSRRVPENRATATVRRLEALAAARDFEAVRDLFRDDHVTVERPTGSTFGPDEAVESLKRLFRGRDPHYEMEPLATLGDSLVLARRRWGAEGATSSSYDVGAYESQVLHVQEVDERGRHGHAEVFADDDLNDAIVWLYARHAECLPEGAERERAKTVARAIARPLGRLRAGDWDGVWSPGAELVDHRKLGLGTLRGFEAVRSWIEAMLEIEESRIRVDEILALEPSAALFRTTSIGRGRVSGGAFERTQLGLWAFAPDGRFERLEFFEVDQEAAALERFDELVSGTAVGASSAQAVSNRATRVAEENVAAWIAGDWDRFMQTMTADFRLSDRRSTSRIELSRDEAGAFLRSLGESAAVRDIEAEILATRGESLALLRLRVQVAGGDVGPSEIVHLDLFEVDEDGGSRYYARWDEDDLEAARAELEARWMAGEAQDHPHVSGWNEKLVHSIAERDWAGLAELGADDLVAYNHRLVGWGRREGVDAWVEPFRAMVDLAPDARMRLDHLRTHARGFMAYYTWVGSRDGGPFETPIVVVTEIGDDGLMRRADIWDVDRVDEAVARFEELADPSAESSASTDGGEAFFTNSAVRAMRRVVVAQAARDLEGIAATFADDFRGSDRRSLVRVEAGREEYLESYRSMVEMTTEPPVGVVVATRGDRLALVRWLWRGAGADVGPSEIEMLHVIEVDDRGDHVAVVTFDPTDVDAACAELDARFEATESVASSPTWQALASFVRAVERRDWDGVVALCADDFVEYDHQKLATLGTVRGAEAWVRSFRELVELAPDTVYRVHHFLPTGRGSYTHGGFFGTREGGPYELVVNAVVELDETGRIVRADRFDDDGIDAALARLAELSGEAANPALGRASASAPVSRSNAASRAARRQFAAWEAKDWERYAKGFSPDVHLSDRRRGIQLELHGDEVITFTRSLGEGAATRATGDVMAVRGDRLALVRLRVEIAGEDVGPSEVVHLNLFQVDERGRARVMIRWDEDDLDAAYAEMEARFAAMQPGASRDERLRIVRPNGAAAWLKEIQRLVNARDFEAFRERCNPDLVYEDRQRRSLVTGGLDTLLSSVRERAEAGARLERCELLGTFGSRVAAQHTFWGGGEENGRFEMEFLVVQEIDDAGKLVAHFNFDVDDSRGAQREAWARWAANEPEAAPAVRLAVEIQEAFIAKDRARWRAAHADDLIVVDHRHAGLGRIEDPEVYTDSLTAFWDLVTIANVDAGWCWPAFGPHGFIIVSRRSGTMREGGGEYEAESLNLICVENGRAKRVEFFEVDALDDALARFEELRPSAAPELATPPPNAASRVMVERWMPAYETGARTGDWEPLRALLHPAMVIEDHQRLSHVSGGYEQHVASMRQRAASGQRGRISLLATAGDRLALLGLLWSGGPPDGRFEIEHLAVVEVDESELLAFARLFDPGDRRTASAMLLERYLASGAEGVPSRSIDLLVGWISQDLERIRRGLCDDLIVEDRRLTGLGRLDGADAYIGAVAAMHELAPDAWEEPLYYVRNAAHGAVAVMRRSGTSADGGAFESPYALVIVRRGDEVSRFEVFEPEQLEEAIQRFEELRPA